jgi:hypothetical protein
MARYSKHFETYQEFLVSDLKATLAYLQRPNIDADSREDNEYHLRYIATEIIANAKPAKNYQEYTYQQG